MARLVAGCSAFVVGIGGDGYKALKAWFSSCSLGRWAEEACGGVERLLMGCCCSSSCTCTMVGGDDEDDDDGVGGFW